jgi:integrase
MRLTRQNIVKLRLPVGKSETIVFDDTLSGFGLRIRAGGKRTWIAQYRIGKKQRRVTLGTVEALGPDEAKKAGKAALAKVQLGSDPQIEKVEARSRADSTLASAANQYLHRAKGRLRASSYREVVRHLEQYWAPLHEMPVYQIRRANIAVLLTKIASTNGPFAANRARATLSAFFSWAMGEGLTESNPVIGTHRPAEEIARDRVLKDEEIRLLRQSAGDGDFGTILRLLVLTGQRPGEVGGMLWSEIDLNRELWNIAADRTKNGLAHDVPLSAPALEIIRGIPRREGRELVFGSRSGPFQGWSKAKGALDMRMLLVLREERGSKAQLLPWRVHDIRRTVATRMADLGVLPHVVEAVLNHISGHKAGVAGIYNRASYAAEKRQALELWADRVSRIVEGSAGGHLQ